MNAAALPVAVLRRCAPLTRARAEACTGVEDRSNAALERFLRARKYDVAVAAAMYLEHRRWRASFSPTPWVQGPGNVANQLAQCKVAMQGLCHDGLPFVIVVARNHRPTGKEGVPELNRAFVYIMDCITAAAGPGGQFRIAVDLRSMTTANADLNAMKVAFDVLQKGFPERCARGIAGHARRLCSADASLRGRVCAQDGAPVACGAAAHLPGAVEADGAVRGAQHAREDQLRGRA